jgi:hypothetical protein
MKCRIGENIESVSEPMLSGKKRVALRERIENIGCAPKLRSQLKNVMPLKRRRSRPRGLYDKAPGTAKRH